MQRIEGSRPPWKAMCLFVFADHIVIDTNRLPVILKTAVKSVGERQGAVSMAL